MKILAIDPGNEESAYVLLSDFAKPVCYAKQNNDNVLSLLKEWIDGDTHLVIEKIASYGMAVGKEVFDTCIWVGRFYEAFKGQEKHYIYRKDVKMNLCHSMKAKDANIIQALKDRFGDKGTVKNPGWFYGFKKDVWQAYAAGVTYYDSLKMVEECK